MGNTQHGRMKGSTFFYGSTLFDCAGSAVDSASRGLGLPSPAPTRQRVVTPRHATVRCGAAVRPRGWEGAARRLFRSKPKRSERKAASRARNSGDRPSIAPGEAMARSVCGRTPWPPSSSPGRQQREQRARAQISRAPARAPRAPRARAAWRSRRVWPLAVAADAQGASPAELLRGGDLYAVLDVQEGPNASAAELKVHISPC